MTSLHAQITLTVNGKTMHHGITFTPPQSDTDKMKQIAILHQIEKLLKPFKEVVQWQACSEERAELKEWLIQAYQNEPDVAQQDRLPT